MEHQAFRPRGAAVTDVLSHKWNKQSHKTLEKNTHLALFTDKHAGEGEGQERRRQRVLPSVRSEQQVHD